MAWGSAQIAWMAVGVALMVVTPGLGAEAAPASTPQAGDEQLRFFESKIRPVLADQCVKCHGPEKAKGELRVDSRGGLLKGGTSQKPGIVPGDVDGSVVIRAIRYGDPDLQMPPKHRLPPEQVADFETWVKAGAADPRVDAPAAAAGGAPRYKSPDPASPEARNFWSFVAPKEQPIPAVKDTAWAHNDVDRFILSKLEERGLTPVPAVDKRTLIRRATFDLTGLPPTPEEVDTFLADGSADAYPKLIDRLLASPAYGERWGRHWLDVARYADTAGDSADYPIPQIYLYRNWVINAFNRDEPYDQFIKEQLAGDLMPARDDADRRDKIIATGFIALSRRFSTSPEEQMHLTIEDSINTTGQAMLGLTLTCARCHDHKFDPIPTKDYYSLFGIFGSSRYPHAGSETRHFQQDFVPLPVLNDTPARKAARDALAAATSEADVARRKYEGAQDPAEKEQFRLAYVVVVKRVQELQLSVPVDDFAYAIVDKPDNQRGDVRIQKGGEPSNQGDLAPRGFLTILGGQKLPPAEHGSGRLELANWVADANNPLTARVMVNRIWQHHFGKGLVRTPNDFGARGARPTHPELLDWLARRFVQEKWSVKSMHRLLMTSQTYQLASASDEKDAAIDANNELFWHFDRQRLEAEAIRDSILAVSGSLDRSVPAAHPFPPMKTWEFSQHAAFAAVYETPHRSVYVMTQRLRRHPFFGEFDGPDPNASTGVRLASTTPLQSLFWMNDKLVHEQSRLLAQKLLSESADDGARVGAAYRRILSHVASADEVAAGVSYLQRYREHLKGTPTQAGDFDREALASLVRVLFSSNEFVFVD